MSRVVIVGLGRVGLPLALALAERGMEVAGIDIDADRVRLLSGKKMPFLERGAQPLLERLAGHRLSFGTSFDVARGADAVILTLGTPIDEHMNPVFTQVEDAMDRLLPHLTEGQQVILRSTVSPGTTRYLARLVESRSPLRIGKTLFLSYCPERIAEGDSLRELAEIPQIVGADDADSRERATALFRLLSPVVHQTDSVSAELAKLFTNMYRYVNFALANEFMMLAEQHGRGIHEIVGLVNEKYKRGGLALPGLASGPCLYKDGFFLVNQTPFTEMVSLAWKINETMPAYLLGCVKRLRPLTGARVALLGMAFKRDIDDTRHSLSHKLLKILKAEGSLVRVHDPFVPSEPLETAVAGADVLFLAVNHTAFKQADWSAIRRALSGDAVICDVWNLTGAGKVVYVNGQTPPLSPA